MVMPDCLGFTLAEARELLAASGWCLSDYYFTGDCQLATGQEDEARVVRLRLVEANKVQLVLADVDTTIPPAKGGVRTDAP